MAHQLAHETLAQVLRVYLGLIARQQQQEEQERQQGTVTKHNATVLRLCRRVGAALAGACVERAARRGGGGGGDPNDPLRAWVASIEAKGVPELKGFWDVDDGGDDGATGPV